MAELAGLQKHLLLDGKLHLFLRPNSSFWWAGFHHKGKYLRTSTKQTKRPIAEQAAKDWYIRKQGEIVSGTLLVSKRTFAQAATRALEAYEAAVGRGERSPETVKGISIVLNARVLPYFGPLPVESISLKTWFDFKASIYAEFPACKRGTLHQYKNAVRVVLNHAYREGWINDVPVFKDSYQGKAIESPRPWFNPDEYKTLLAGIRAHIKHLQDVKPRWVPAAQELYDYVIFATNTGMRVGELKNTRVCDIEVRSEKDGPEYLIVRNIAGKRGLYGVCRSFYGAPKAFRSIVARREIAKPSKCTEPLFLENHRDMFNLILNQKGLKFSNGKPPLKRDFVSLRATYICFRLLNGASVYEIANNCRTSVAMIENSYARAMGGEILEGVNKIKGSVEGWNV